MANKSINRVNGKYTAELLEKFDSGTPLSDEELKSIHDGLEFLYGFFRAEKNNALSLYYSMQIESIERILVARKERVNYAE